MECDKCGENAVLHAAYSGLHLCESHLCRAVTKRVRRRIREDGLVSDDATVEDPETWVIGLSGGKDSVVLTQILHDTFAEDPRIELVALSIHEGIEGYRDASLEACEELTDDLGIEHVTVSYAEEFGVQMDDVVEDDPEGMAACAYCGVFRRDLLSKYADELDADKLLTGHNLDDEAETALMNFLEAISHRSPSISKRRWDRSTRPPTHRRSRRVRRKTTTSHGPSRSVTSRRRKSRCTPGSKISRRTSPNVPTPRRLTAARYRSSCLASKRTTPEPATRLWPATKNSPR